MWNGHSSEYLPITNWVIQDGVLSRTHLNTYTDDTEDGLISTTLQLAAEKKVVGRELTPKDGVVIQKNVDNIIQCFDKWQMSINPGTYFRTRNRKYNMSSEPLRVVNEE